MAYVREETLGNFTDEELIEIVKRNLDKLGIPYEEGPGDWTGFLGLDPADLDDMEEPEECHTIPVRQARPTVRGRYCAQAPVDYEKKRA